MDKKLPSKIANIVLIVVIISVSFITVLFKSDTHLKVSDVLSQKDTALMRNTQVQSVIKSLGTSNTNASVPGLSQPMDPNSWYTDMPNLKGSTDNPISINGFDAYPQPPWDSTNKTYFFNSYKAREDLYNYLTSLGASPHRREEKYDYLKDVTINRYGSGIDSIARRCPTGRTSKGFLYGKVDGMKCIFACALPAIVSKTYYSSGYWGKKSWEPGYNWQTYKFCLVLTENNNDVYDTSKYLYIPAVAGSAKAHTYPWGVCQTNICIESSTQLAYPAEHRTGPSSDWAQKIHVSDAGTDEGVKEVIKKFKWQNTNILYGLHDMCEICGWPSNLSNNDFDKYKLVGYLSY